MPYPRVATSEPARAQSEGLIMRMTIRCAVVSAVFILCVTSIVRGADPAQASKAPEPDTVSNSPFQEENAPAELKLPCDEACCPNECEKSCCDRFEPTWTVTTDALFLHRSATSGPTLLSDTVGNDLLKSSDLGFSWAAGPRLSLIRDCACGWGLELNYFGIDGWEANAAFPTASLPGGVGSLAIDKAIPLPVTEASFGQNSRLYNGEFNVRRQVNENLTLLAGFRWVELQDTYLVQGTSAILATPFSEAVRAHNHLYGFQIGADALLFEYMERFRIRGIAKTGIFYDAAGQSTGFSDPAGLGVLNAGDNGNHTSFLGELGVLCSYRLSKHAALRGGYQLMWIDGVALATRQIPNTDLGAGTAAIDTTGGVFYHGANVGLELAW